MKKVSIFLSIWVLASMVLAACGIQATSTSAPNTQAPPATPEVTSTSEVPSGTETLAVTETANPETTTTASIPVTGGENPARLSNELNFTVLNQNGDQIGGVDDIVIDLDQLMVSYVAVGTGGIQGVSGTTKLVPWDFLQLQSQTNDTTGEQNAFVFQGDQSLLDNAPDTDLSTLPQIGEPAADWDSAIRDYWNSAGTPGTSSTSETPSVNDTSTPLISGTTSTPSISMTALPGTSSTPGTSMTTMPEGTTTSGVGMLQGVALASDVLNASITLGTPAMNLNQTQNMPAATTESATAMPNTGRGAQGISVAIDDLIVDTSSGKIKYIVIDTSFGKDEHWIPVPLNLLQWDSGNQAFVLNTDVTALQNAPSFQGGQYPDTSSNGWDGDLSNYWQNK